MSKTVIKIKCQNGFTVKTAVDEIFPVVSDLYEFVETDEPDFILFGPYGIDIPAKGAYTRIGYFCENITPDFEVCEWAFGVPREEEFNRPNYKRIQWHGIDPQILIKNLNENEIDKRINENKKKKFCNFLYSNPVYYREEFFRQLSKYKKIDAPGRSMKNMPSIDELYQGDIWERKRSFISQYKMTIAFENYCYPGYQTEKLYDAMRINSLPIYCGDPYVSEVFNTKSFIHAREHIQINRSGFVQNLELKSQPNFKSDCNPGVNTRLDQKVIRKLKIWGRELKMKLELSNVDFNPLIEHIIKVDRDETLYAEYLRNPWFNGNTSPKNVSSRDRWIEIFGGKSN